MDTLKLSIEEQLHLELMQHILLNLQDKPLILKGGTALLLGYNLDRFSEDIDLDTNKSFNLESDIKKAFDKTNKFSLLNIRTPKDTNTTKRYVIEYDNQLEVSRLKIELSLRNGLQLDKSQLINGIRIYNIDELIEQKTSVLNYRSKIRDLYDVNFLMNNYQDHFSIHQLERIHHLGNAENIQSLYQYSYDNDNLTSHISLEELCIIIEEKCNMMLDEKQR